MAATTVCKICEDPLVVEIEEDGDGEDGGSQTVPDDLELSCGCHFHWQCLLDQSSDVAITLKCPSCQFPLAQNNAGPSVTNPFLAANPQARPARAFHVLCSEGDVDGIVDLLRDIEQGEDEDGDDDEPRLTPTQLIRYQDPLANMKSGLHLAIEQGREEVVWLLLWLASPLRTDAFPRPLREIALALGLQRPVTPPSDDIRALQDDQGRAAETIAAEGEGLWATLLQSNVLHPGSS